jgi:membrane fusion protein, heavy metal efflux system
VSAEQWTRLRVEPVQVVEFDSVVVADGVVAINDNAAVAIYSPLSGRVTAVQAQLGQSVRKGEHLLSMLGIEAAQGNSDLAAAAAAEATSRKQLEVAELAEARQHELALEEAGAEKDWLQSQLDLASAQNGLRAAQADLAAARDKTAIFGAGSARGGLGAGEARIDAPIDGVVIQRQVARGQIVTSLSNGGSAPLFTVADLRSVWVLASVREVDAARLKLGQAMEISAPHCRGDSCAPELPGSHPSSIPQRTGFLSVASSPMPIWR